MRKVSQADRETPREPPEQEKQEALEKLGLSPPSSQRPFSLISHLCFPDVAPHDGRCGRVFSCPDFLIKLPPELLLRDGHCSSLNCAMKGVPFVIWLYNRLNVEDCVSYSPKHDGPLCCVSVNNVAAGRKGSHNLKCVSSAGDAERSTVTKGWHLHALVLLLAGLFGGPPTHPHCFQATQPAEAHLFKQVLTPDYRRGLWHLLVLPH